MEGTIVYAIERFRIIITPTPLLPVIMGGMQRLVSRAETVVMDGTLSADPDFPENRNFRYIWRDRYGIQYIPSTVKSLI